MTWDTNYYFFTDPRTEKMEELFNITVTDDVKLLHYEDSSFAIAVYRSLTLEVEDYDKFIHNNIKSDIESYAPYSSDGLYDDDDTLYYKYANSRTYMEISPSENKGKYIISLNIRE